MGMKEIAEMTGLSITTVSHAINGTRKVSKDSIKKINDAIEATGFKPNVAARAMRAHRSNYVGLVFPLPHRTDFTNEYYFDVLGGAKKYLRSVNYELIIANYDERTQGCRLNDIPILGNQFIDGAIVVPSDSNLETLGPNSAGIPIVLTDKQVSGSNLPVVYVDVYPTAYKLISNLITSKKRKRIGLIAPVLNSSKVLKLFSAYKNALKDNGLKYEHNLVLTGLPTFFENGEHAAQSLVEQGCDAIVCLNSMLSLGVISYLQNSKVYVKDNLDFITIGAVKSALISTIPFTSIDLDPGHLGAVTAKILIEYINTGKYPAQTKTEPRVFKIIPGKPIEIINL